MSSTETVESEGELTLKWETMGLEDRPVEVARTVTMGTECYGPRKTPAELVRQLPNLVDDREAEELPELQIKETLGEGGMGRVELAEQLPLGRDVAVKQVRDKAKSEASTLVLLREGWTTGILEHPNIVPVYTLGRNSDDDPVIVMKKIAGISWLDIIDNPELTPDGFEADDPVELHVEILLQLCNAVDYAHSRGIIHRDLKPENVMLGEFGEVYLLDWGIAVCVDDTHSDRLATVDDVDAPAGTPAYMAPEMTEGEGQNLGIHSDVFLLGAMLYEALTGAPPYSGETLYEIMIRAYRCKPPEFNPSVPPELQAICRRAMARDPEDRFPSVRAMRRALLEYRKHRQSRRLADTGDTCRNRVEALLDAEQRGQDVDEPTLYKSFGECRFAYEQALEINADNTSARQALQDVLERMADRAIERDAYKAASLLISDLPRANQQLERRLDELEQRLANRREDYEELKEIRRDVDVEVGRPGRVVFVMILGIVWLLFSTSLAPLIALEVIDVTYPRLFGHIVGVTAIIGIATVLGRNIFFTNAINRRMILCANGIFAGALVHRGIAWYGDIGHLPMIALEMLLYAVAAAMMAIALDRRLFGAAIPFLIAAVGSIGWPALVFWFFAGANFVTVAAMLWLWWPDDPRAEWAQLVGEC